jgi:predicted nucleic acid-binding protein
MTQVSGPRAVVLDTMALTALFDDRTPSRGDPYRQVLGSGTVIASFASVAELRYGTKKAGWGDLRRRALERNLATVSVQKPDDEAIEVYAELRADCERRGHPLGQKIHEADRWVAVTALRLGLSLLSDDRVFGGVPGLTVLTTSDS